MKTLRTTPRAKRLIDSLRDTGYDFSTAVADIVDNSITANSTRVDIEILPKTKSRPALVYISDDGDGMDRETLHEAMRFGSDQEYKKGDLGKYGLGLKTASLSQCRRLTVATKAKSAKEARPRKVYMRWDLNHIDKSDEWDVLLPIEADFQSWEIEVLNSDLSSGHGTVVLWEDLSAALDILSMEETLDRERKAGKLIHEVGEHLSMVFHRFMQGNVPGRRRLNIHLCGIKLEPWDPFCRNEKTNELDILSLDLGIFDKAGSRFHDRVTVSPFVLPREDEFSSTEAWKVASGPRNWNQQQGFYFYRNNRLLQAGGWSRIRSVDEHLKLLRVAIDFTDAMDEAFSINVTKMRATIPLGMREKLLKNLTEWTKAADTRYRKSVKASGAASKRSIVPLPADSVSLGHMTIARGHNARIKAERSSGGITLTMPKNHSVFDKLFDSNKKMDAKKFNATLMAILEALHVRKIAPSAIPIKELWKIYRRL